MVNESVNFDDKEFNSFAIRTSESEDNSSSSSCSSSFGEKGQFGSILKAIDNNDQFINGHSDIHGNSNIDFVNRPRDGFEYIKVQNFSGSPNYYENTNHDLKSPENGENDFEKFSGNEENEGFDLETNGSIVEFTPDAAKIVTACDNYRTRNNGNCQDEYDSQLVKEKESGVLIEIEDKNNDGDGDDEVEDVCRLLNKDDGGENDDDGNIINNVQETVKGYDEILSQNGDEENESEEDNVDEDDDYDGSNHDCDSNCGCEDGADDIDMDDNDDDDDEDSIDIQLFLAQLDDEINETKSNNPAIDRGYAWVITLGGI